MQLDRLGMAQMILAGCSVIFKGLPDDVLKIQVHADMKAESAAKEKPRHEDGAWS